MATPRKGSQGEGRRRPKPPAPDPSPKRERGRPSLPLSGDPERYFLALLSAHIEIGKLSGVSEGRVLTTFAGFVFGQPIQTPENLSNMERTGTYQVGMRRWLWGEESAVWRGKTTFRPPADNLGRKLRRIRAKPSSHPDWVWLRAMTLAWRDCLLGELRPTRSGEFANLGPRLSAKRNISRRECSRCLSNARQKSERQARRDTTSRLNL